MARCDNTLILLSTPLNPMILQSTPNRRHFLRGLGTCLTLPALESLAAPAAAVAAPRRMAFLYIPNGVILD